MTITYRPAYSSVEDLVPYSAGKPIEEVARELGIPESDIIKMASNENPAGPSPLGVQAIKDSGLPVAFVGLAYFIFLGVNNKFFFKMKC